MKKGAQILILLLCAIFAFTSCDAAIDLMGKMGNNIMGTNTSHADKAIESATVSDDAIEETGGEGSKVNTTSGEIKLSDNLSVTVTADLSEVTTILPAIDTNTISDIASAIKTTESTAKLVTSMSETASPTVQEGARGTATVMKAVLDTYVEKLTGSTGSGSTGDSGTGDGGTGDGGTSGTSSTMTAVANAINSLSNTLTEISADPSTVTKGDVVTLQLIENFATQVVASVDTTTGKFIEENISDLLSSANTLATVTTSLSDASKFELNLSSLLSDAMGIINSGSGDDVTTGSITSRNIIDDAQDLADDPSKEDVKDIIHTIQNTDISDYAGIIRTLYSEIKKVIGNEPTKSVSTLSLHKGSYETYVSVASSTGRTGDRSFKSFASYDGLIKYTVASALSELDRYYKVFTTDENKTKLGLDKVEGLPTSIWSVLTEIETDNPWLLNASAEAKLVVPENCEDLIRSIAKAFEEENSDQLQEDMIDIIRGNAGQTISALETINTMLSVVSLTDLLSVVGASGNADIAAGVQAAIDWLNGVETSTGSNN